MKLRVKNLLIIVVVIFSSIWIYEDRLEDSKSYNAVCLYNCKSVDVTDTFNTMSFDYILKDPRFSRVVLQNSNYGDDGSFYITANYKDENGNTIRTEGVAVNVDERKINWPLIGDAKITYLNGRVYLYGSDSILKSVNKEFLTSLNIALENLSDFASMHDDDIDDPPSSYRSPSDEKS